MSGRAIEAQVQLPQSDAVSAAAAKAAMPHIVRVVAEEAARRAPVGRTKRLKDSIEGKVDQGGRRGVVAATAPHAHLVHEGTKAHATALKRRSKARALAIPVRGRLVFRHSAEHPGSKRQPFLTEAVTHSRGQIERVLRQHGEQIIERATR